MKTILLSFAFLFMSGLAIAKVKIPVCFPCDEVEVVHDLPNEEDFTEDGMSYVDVGYLYKSYGILYVPVWNTDGQYVLFNGATETYYEVDQEYLEELSNTYNFEMQDHPLGFWKKFGGKILFLVLIGLGIYGSIGGDDEDEIVEETDATDKDPVVIIKEDDKPTV